MSRHQCYYPVAIPRSATQTRRRSRRLSGATQDHNRALKWGAQRVCGVCLKHRSGRRLKFHRCSLVDSCRSLVQWPFCVDVYKCMLVCVN